MSDLPAQPSLRRMKAFGIRPNRELGQNFLIDSNLLDVISRAAEVAPLDRILVETDAPYLTPQAVRKHRNQPAFVVHTARFVAERRGIAYEELEAAVEANAARLLGW